MQRNMVVAAKRLLDTKWGGGRGTRMGPQKGPTERWYTDLSGEEAVGVEKPEAFTILLFSCDRLPDSRKPASNRNRITTIVGGSKETKEEQIKSWSRGPKDQEGKEGRGATARPTAAPGRARTRRGGRPEQTLRRQRPRPRPRPHQRMATKPFFWPCRDWSPPPSKRCSRRRRPVKSTPPQMQRRRR